MKCKKDGKGQAESSRSSHTLPSTVSGLHTWQPRLSYIPLGQRTALAALRQCWSRCLGEWLARVVEIPIAKIQRAPIQVFCQMPNGSTFYAAKKTKVKRQRTVPRLATLRLARWVSAKLAALSLWAEFSSAKVKVSCVYREAPQKKVTELEVVLIVRFHCAGTSRNFLCKTFGLMQLGATPLLLFLPVDLTWSLQPWCLCYFDFFEQVDALAITFGRSLEVLSVLVENKEVFFFKAFFSSHFSQNELSSLFPKWPLQTWQGARADKAKEDKAECGRGIL